MTTCFPRGGDRLNSHTSPFFPWVVWEGSLRHKYIYINTLYISLYLLSLIPSQSLSPFKNPHLWLALGVVSVRARDRGGKEERSLKDITNPDAPKDRRWLRAFLSPEVCQAIEHPPLIIKTARSRKELRGKG